MTSNDAFDVISGETSCPARRAEDYNTLLVANFSTNKEWEGAGARVRETDRWAGQRAQCTVVVGGFLTLSQRDHENTLSAFFQARMNRFQFFFHIYNTLNYLINKTFIFPPVKYLFKQKNVAIIDLNLGN